MSGQNNHQIGFSRWEELKTLATRQHGFFTTQQALQLGYSHSNQTHHVHQGNWLRVFHGVYRLPWVEETQDSRLAKWCLWTRNHQGRIQGLVSHESALYHYGLLPNKPAEITLTVPPEFRKKPPLGLRLHKAVRPETESEGNGFLRITTPLRALQDTRVRLIESHRLAATLQLALDMGLASPEAVAHKFGPQWAETGQSREASLAQAPSSHTAGNFFFPADETPGEDGKDLVPALQTSFEPTSEDIALSFSHTPDDLPSPFFAPELNSQFTEPQPAKRRSLMTPERERPAALRRRREAGFTLVELLVVVAIISVLAGMLLPALGRARDLAMQLQCTNNIRQVGLASLSYGETYGGFLVTHFDTGTVHKYWPEYLIEGRFLEEKNVLVCPSYKPNRWTYVGANYGVFRDPPSPYHRSLPANTHYLLLNAVVQPSRLLHYADSVNYNSTPPQQTILIFRDLTRIMTYKMAVQIRHQNAANGWFVDGHAKICSKPELKDCDVEAVADEKTNIVPVP